MIYLLIVSLLWAFSFGLIKMYLIGLDSNFVAFSRLGLSMLVFLPFLRIKSFDLKKSGKLVLIGAWQYGVMYLCYILSYQYLKSYEVALFTIFTPLYISIINDLINKKFNKIYLLKSLIAIIGAAVITYKGSDSENVIKGFLILQIANLAFGSGQLFYKKTMGNTKVEDKNIFALLYIGATILTAIFAGFTVSFETLEITNSQIIVLCFLGIIASGFGFFLWNYGARKTDTGTLAVSNNLVIPLAVFVSLTVFGESVDIMKLIIGGFIISVALFFEKIPSFRKNN